MSRAIHKAIGTNKSGRSWETLVGYSLDDLAYHLESQFDRGMEWRNIGSWHIDHIVPKSLFRYEHPEDPEFAICWSLANLRPMWGADNISKRDSLPEATDLSDVLIRQLRQLDRCLPGLEWVMWGEFEVE
ncbi:MAG: hypothetical protein ACYCX5_13175 [Coriobacteriia bacterium]